MRRGRCEAGCNYIDVYKYGFDEAGAKQTWLAINEIVTKAYPLTHWIGVNGCAEAVVSGAGQQNTSKWYWGVRYCACRVVLREREHRFHTQHRYPTAVLIIAVCFLQSGHSRLFKLTRFSLRRYFFHQGSHDGYSSKKILSNWNNQKWSGVIQRSFFVINPSALSIWKCFRFEAKILFFRCNNKRHWREINSLKNWEKIVSLL